MNASGILDLYQQAVDIKEADIKKFKCDVCGEPATNWAKDTSQLAKPDNYDVGPILLSFGCDQHPVESQIHITDLSFLRGMPQADAPHPDPPADGV